MSAHRIITPDIVIAFSICPRKAHLLLQDLESKVAPDYVSMLDRHQTHNQIRHGVQPNSTLTSVNPGNFNQFNQDTVSAVKLTVDDMEAYCDILTRYQSADGISVYEPTIVTGTYKIQKEQVLHLAFAGYILGHIQEHFPSSGRIITMSGETHKVNLQENYASIKTLVSSARKWLSGSQTEIAPVALNEHCPYCYYEKSCRAIAESKNDITLLDRVTPKVARQYHKKGIFTVEQLSYLFRPRKKRRPEKKKITLHKPELQALAIKNGKIYVHETPNISRQSTELFLDIEGIPDQDSYYLIGLLVAKADSETFFSFWADRMEDEERIWLQLIDIIKAYPDAPIYHYGSYESRFFSKMTSRYAADLDDLSDRLRNLNSLIHGKVYFPVRSNGLKDLATFAGARWTAPGATGLQSLVWRYLWEESLDTEYKEQLITYNREDCYAAKQLLIELVRISSSADKAEDIDFPDRPKQFATTTGEQIHSEFTRIIRSAHADYEKAKLTIREKADQKKDKKRGGIKGHQGYIRITPKTRRVVHIPPRTECPKCADAPLRATQKVIDATVIDIAFTRHGCKKIITRHTSFYAYCRKCTQEYGPPDLSMIGRPQMFGHGLRTWVIYHRVILRLSYTSIIQALEDQFKETMSTSTIVRFINNFADAYTDTKKSIVEMILSGAYVHVDETRISIEGETHYVWVFTNGSHVFFEITQTRESDIVHKTLTDYKGILISDFYGGYDSVDCVQQKCLVHLIRDMNEDLWKHPFDTEFELFIAEFKNLITPILNTIDKQGSKKAHLMPFKKNVDNFFESTIRKSYSSEPATKYQKRFIRFRQSLFTFLEHDDIPWNNNTAERAIRHLAIQRKISGSFFQPSAQNYLVLLSIAQTCRFQGKSFLDFLLSKEKDVDSFRKRAPIHSTIPVKRREADNS